VWCSADPELVHSEPVARTPCSTRLGCLGVGQWAVVTVVGDIAEVPGRARADRWRARLPSWYYRDFVCCVVTVKSSCRGWK